MLHKNLTDCKYDELVSISIDQVEVYIKDIAYSSAKKNNTIFLNIASYIGFEGTKSVGFEKGSIKEYAEIVAEYSGLKISTIRTKISYAKRYYGVNKGNIKFSKLQILCFRYCETKTVAELKKIIKSKNLELL